MALTFPRTDIVSLLDFSADTEPLKPIYRREFSRTVGGISRVAELGSMLWRANYATIPMPTQEVGEVEADLLSLQGGIYTFEAHDPRHPLPASDKLSALTGVTVDSITVDRDAISLKGLPSGFVITKGDWISVDDGTNLNLMKVLETVTANGSGVSPQFAVMPGVRPAVSVNDAVTLRYAPARWMITDYARTPRGPLYEVINFTADQVFE